MTRYLIPLRSSPCSSPGALPARPPSSRHLRRTGGGGPDDFRWPGRRPARRHGIHVPGPGHHHHRHLPRDVWKGAASPVTQLEFLGGTIEDLTMEVVDSPRFALGQRDVLFVGNTTQVVSPLVGLMHGRLRIERDAASGVDRVRTFDGRLLGSVAELGAARPPALTAITAMRLSEVKAAVLGRVAAGGGRDDSPLRLDPGRRGRPARHVHAHERVRHVRLQVEQRQHPDGDAARHRHRFAERRGDQLEPVRDLGPRQLEQLRRERQVHGREQLLRRERVGQRPQQRDLRRRVPTERRLGTGPSR